MSAVTAALVAGVNENQTVRGENSQDCGSLGSVVASVLSTQPLNGKLGMAVALAKLSFDGGAARTLGALNEVSIMNATVTEINLRLTILVFIFSS
jgi:hypothetical protein